MLENLYTPDCIRTVTGRYVNVFDPQPHMFCIEDIAHALANIPRFGGHLPRWYSVGQHCLHVCDLVAPEHQLEALLHDATEAYLTDMPKPIKDRLPDYLEVERKLHRFLAEGFGLPPETSPVVKAADRRALEMEWTLVMLGPGHPGQSLKRSVVRDRFVRRFHDLVAQREQRAQRAAENTTTRR